MISSFYIITPSSTTITYDKNGNLIRESGRRNASYTFDADNRLTSVTIAPLIRGEREMPGMAFRRGGLVEPGVTSTYLYDSSGQRIYSKDVTMSSAGAILETRETYTISKTYSETYINGVLKTKNTHIFAGDLMLASVEYGGGSDAPLIKGELKGDLVIYHLSDHLGSTSVSTDASGSITELSDYYAYGSERQSVHSNTSPEKRKYIGQEYDISTGLNYLNARYYNSAIGRFISQDPVFWDIGINAKVFEKKYGKSQFVIMANPQELNSYSYAANNPIRLSDPTGKIPDPTDVAAAACGPFAVACFAGKELLEYAIISAGIIATEVFFGKVEDSTKEKVTTPEVSTSTATPPPPPCNGGNKDGKSKHEGYLNWASNATQEQLQKSIDSLTENIRRHENLIRDPERYLKEYGKPEKWNEMSEIQKEGTIKSWQKEIQTFKEQIGIASQCLLKK